MQHSDVTLGCLSLDSYIKPQRIPTNTPHAEVVYLLIPTSNHNHGHVPILWYSVVYLLIPTSNHNEMCVILCIKGLFIS